MIPKGVIFLLVGAAIEIAIVVLVHELWAIIIGYAIFIGIPAFYLQWEQEMEWRQNNRHLL